MNRRPLFVGVALVTTAALMGCPKDDPVVVATPDDAEAGPPTPSVDAGLMWRIVLDKLDGSLLSVWGSSETDVWTVGGPLGNAGLTDALILRFNGTAWTQVTPPSNVVSDAGVARSYWWVHGSSANDVWLVGESGRATHWDGNTLTEVATGTDATLFGVWAASPSDAWAVGGTPDAPNASNDVVLHWDGATWKPETLPELKKSALFKVWGASADDIYVVGEQGIIWHRKGGTWTREAEGIATGRLTTVSGCSANEIYAVGGRDILMSKGDGTWTRAPIDQLTIVNDVNGVSCSPDGANVVIVGGGSLKLRLNRATAAWESDFGSEPFTDLHGAWADRTGAFWGVGGQFTAAARPNASRQGVVGRFGSNVISSVIRK